MPPIPILLIRLAALLLASAPLLVVLTLLMSTSLFTPSVGATLTLLVFPLRVVRHIFVPEKRFTTSFLTISFWGIRRKGSFTQILFPVCVFLLFQWFTLVIPLAFSALMAGHDRRAMKVVMVFLHG